MDWRSVLRSVFSLRQAEPNGSAETFRCIRCGAEFDRQYPSCSICGGAFVVEVNPKAAEN